VSIEAVGYLAPLAATPGVDAAAVAGTGVAGNATAPSGPGFGELLARGLDQVNRDLVSSQTDVQSLALGDAQNLHHVMMRLEEAKLAFQLAVQVRSRLLEAYQEIMRMQV